MTGEESAYLGAGSRLAEGPSNSMASLAFGHELDGAAYLWPGLSLADMAHTMALSAAGVIPDAQAVELLEALLQADEKWPTPPELDPTIGDVYNNREVLVRSLAADVTGWLPTGRARREATTIAWQLACRQRIERLARSVVQLDMALAEVAEQHVTTLMPDFTYLQHAHPTTLAHYLLAHAGPVGRHHRRILDVHELVNRSPAGSGSVNGTAIPLDRDYLAGLLGFDGLIEHTRDAMWAPDLAIDQLNIATQVFTSVDRLAEELQLWCTEEFSFVRLADKHCRTSVVMPQKKNPYALTALRGTARFAIPTATSVISTMLTVSGQPDNRTSAYLWVPRLLDEAAAAASLLAEVLRDCEFDVASLGRGASGGFMESTEICDYLTLRFGVPNRLSHRVVGLAVRRAIDHGRDTLEVTDISVAAVELDIELPDLTGDELRSFSDSASIVQHRQTTGGAGTAATAGLLANTRRRIATSEQHWAEHTPKGEDLRLLASHFAENLRAKDPQ